MSVLLDASTRQRGYFDPKGVQRMLNEHFEGRRDHSARIWRFLMFELWHRNFLANVEITDATGHLNQAASLGGG